MNGADLDRAVAIAHAAGLTYAQIGRNLGVTRERARQRAHAHEMRERRAAERALVERERRARAIHYECARKYRLAMGPGVSRVEIMALAWWVEHGGGEALAAVG